MQEAVKIGLGLKTRPTAKQMAPLAEPWRPLRGAAAHLWWSYYRAIKKREGVIAGKGGRQSPRAQMPPFLRDPKRYRFCRQGNAAKTAGSRRRQCWTRTDDVSIAAENWLAQFESAIAKPDESSLKTLFHPDSYWRDVLALSWNLQTINGADAIVRELTAHAGRAAPRGLRIDPDRAAPRRVTRAGTSAIEAIFRFETAKAAAAASCG